MLSTVFDFYKIGIIECEIGGQSHQIAVDVCDHGARFRTTAIMSIETDTGIIDKTKTICFGEGRWLSLPSIEEVVLEVLGGTQEEVEELSRKYDDLLSASLPELITGNLITGFVKLEWDRLKEESDIPS